MQWRQEKSKREQATVTNRRLDTENQTPDREKTRWSRFYRPLALPPNNKRLQLTRPCSRTHVWTGNSHANHALLGFTQQIDASPLLIGSESISEARQPMHPAAYRSLGLHTTRTPNGYDLNISLISGEANQLLPRVKIQKYCLLSSARGEKLHRSVQLYIAPCEYIK